MVENLPANAEDVQETWVRSLGWEDLLEKEMATHSNILAWRIPWTEEPGGLSAWSPKESDTTGRLSNSNNRIYLFIHSKYTIIVYRVYQKYKR